MQTTSAPPVSGAAAALAEPVRFRTVTSRPAHEVDTGVGFDETLSREL